MRAYRLEWKPSAAKTLAALPADVQRRIAPRIDALAASPRPHGCVKIEGEADLYRIRIGQYRVVYQVRDNVLLVLVLRVGKRDDVYRGL